MDYIKINHVFVVGSIAYDDIMDFPYEFKDYFHPEYLHKINVSFVVNNLKRQLGGTATNLAYSLKLMCESKISILSAVGQDGEEFIKFYKKQQIDSSYITVDKRLYTATGKVITDIKNNQIWGFYYGASARTSKNTNGKLQKSSSLLILSATHKTPFLKLQQEAIRNKVQYVYDPGMVLTWIKDADLKKGILGSQMVIANDYEMTQIVKRTKLTGRELCERGIAVVVTLGEKGVVYQDAKSMHRVNAYPVKKVVDPTGAGDGFRAGFISALIGGKSVLDALKQGNALASIVIEKYGTTNHKASKQELNKRVKMLKVV